MKKIRIIGLVILFSSYNAVFGQPTDLSNYDSLLSVDFVNYRDNIFLIGLSIEKDSTVTIKADSVFTIDSNLTFQIVFIGECRSGPMGRTNFPPYKTSTDDNLHEMYIYPDHRKFEMEFSMCSSNLRRSERIMNLIENINSRVKQHKIASFGNKFLIIEGTEFIPYYEEPMYVSEAHFVVTTYYLKKL